MASSLIRIRPWLLPIGVMACLLVILLPLPAAVMDMLLAANIAVAVVILLSTIHVRTPLEFSVFPTLLLATTLSRLVLNIATTRLILTGAPTAGESAAGGVIETFGRFVAGNQLEVGLVIFLILITVQFVVITKGATRISEVAARFALDGMPGRQAAIDAEVNAGNMDAKTASQKREDLLAEADFYAAMDGAGKFVRGDAVAGLVITAINILGGLYLGIFVSGMGVGEAAGVFTKLTIGDGLVSQLPSLLISLAAGILVTRGTRETDLADDAVSQVFGNARSLLIAGGFLVLLLFSGLPVIPLLLLGGGFFLIGTSLLGKEDAEDAPEEEETPAVSQKRVEDFLAVDPLEVAIGLGLLPLADPNRGGDLMQRISSLRNQMAAEIGIVLPKVRVRDDATLADEEYEIRMHGDLLARNTLRIDRLMAIDDGRTTGTLTGETAEPIGEWTCQWIAPEEREKAAIFGFKTMTASDVLSDHLEQVARRHADELLSRDATKHLLDELKQIAPAMVSELVPDVMSIADVQKVLQGLLREGIAIRQLGIILESLSDAARSTSDTDEQIERVRQRLARTLCAGLRDAGGVMRVIRLDASSCRDLCFDDEVSIARNNESSNHSKPSDVTCDQIAQAAKKLTDEGYPSVLLVDPEYRRRVKQITEEWGLWINVLSPLEITSDTTLQAIELPQSASPSAAA